MLELWVWGWQRPDAPAASGTPAPAEVPVPAELQSEMEAKRAELVEHVAEVGATGRRRRCRQHAVVAAAALPPLQPPPLPPCRARSRPNCHLSAATTPTARLQVDEALGEHFVLEEPIDGDMLQEAVRR